MLTKSRYSKTVLPKRTELVNVICNKEKNSNAIREKKKKKKTIRSVLLRLEEL